MGSRACQNVIHHSDRGVQYLSIQDIRKTFRNRVQFYEYKRVMFYAKTEVFEIEKQIGKV